MGISLVQLFITYRCMLPTLNKNLKEQKKQDRLRTQQLKMVRELCRNGAPWYLYILFQKSKAAEKIASAALDADNDEDEDDDVLLRMANQQRQSGRKIWLCSTCEE